jgi:hypothetical protein
MTHTTITVAEEVILNKIYVETKQLKRQVRRNIDRFPEDFMFELTSDEYESLRSHFGTLKKEDSENLRSQFGTSSWGGARYPPMAFTEQGVAMLSSVLNSPRAIQVNIQIIRIFTRMREMILNHKDVLLKLEQLERQTLDNTKDVKAVFEYLKQMLVPVEQVNRRRIGFRDAGEEE